MSFTKLSEDFVFSSIVAEEDALWKIFSLFLATCKADGISPMTAPSISSITKKPLEEVLRLINMLESPDPHSRSTVDSGRRIRKVDGGYFVINYQHYRAKDAKDYFKEKQRLYREKCKDFGIELGNGNFISWPFYQKIINKCHDKDQAAHVVYRAKDKDDPQAWITAGLKKENAYALIACSDEDMNPQKVRDWIDVKIYRITPDTLRGTIKGLLP